VHGQRAGVEGSWLAVLSFLHRLLLLLPPDAAHRLGMVGLRLFQWTRVPRRVIAVPSIVVPTPGLVFASRVGCAAGLDKDARVVPALAALGFGFIEVGSVTPKAQPGNSGKRLWRWRGVGLVNRMGFNSCGLEEFRRHLEAHRRIVSGIPLLGNIGKGRQTPLEEAVEDYAAGFAALAGVVDAFVVNVSSPNTPGLVGLQNVGFVERIAARAPPGVAVFLKFSPDLPDAELSDLLLSVRDEPRFSGVVLTNTSRELARSLGGFPEGGISGEPLRERALHCVAMARGILGGRKTIIGVGGIMDRPSAKRFREAGADLVEIYTGFVLRGPRLLRELEGLE